MTQTSQEIDILLSTYNGSKYIGELIESLLQQTYSNWKLLIRDDGSTDNTLDIIENYRLKHPDKIKIIVDGKGNLGPSRSFGRLLEESTAEYIMFCDQDDVWKADKILITLDKMLSIEGALSQKIPILVHTDLEVVDTNLNIIAKSFFRYQKVRPENKTLSRLLVQNNVTGCTMMINKQLKELALPIPAEAIMHDWWLAMVAAAFGKIECIEKGTILYRQHGNNDVGAKKYSLAFLLKKVIQFKKSIETIKRTVYQGKIFYDTYKPLLNKNLLQVSYDFATLLHKNKYSRIKTVLNNKYYKQGILRNMGFIFLLLIMNRDLE